MMWNLVEKCGRLVMRFKSKEVRDRNVLGFLTFLLTNDILRKTLCYAVRTSRYFMGHVRQKEFRS